MSKNIDLETVDGFGYEWSTFDQSSVSDTELKKIFDSYFSIFDWSKLTDKSVGFDMGCGSGRWARFVSPRVGSLHLIDASKEALEIAKINLNNASNCIFHHASVDHLPFENNTMDFGYSLGVLHHIPNTQAALRSCVEKLKPGAPFLVYLYYAFDNRPTWFQLLWKISDTGRKMISRLPNKLKYFITQIIATFIYWPLARTAKIIEKLGFRVGLIPLSSYRNTSFYTMRTDSFDRFATRLEQRFTRKEMQQMMIDSGLKDIKFSEEIPFWCCVGYKK